MNCQETFYLKKAQELSKNDKIDIIEEEGELCKVCSLQDHCPGHVSNFGSSPVYPPCADAVDFTEKYVDEELLNEAVSDILYSTKAR